MWRERRNLSDNDNQNRPPLVGADHGLYILAVLTDPSNKEGVMFSILPEVCVIPSLWSLVSGYKTRKVCKLLASVSWFITLVNRYRVRFIA